jgi:transcription-repair coupling factor (superfamily II helicase)
VQATPRNEAMLAVVGMESGFETDNSAVISEQDILGDRLVRPRKASRKARQFSSPKSRASQRRSRGPCRSTASAVSWGCQTLEVFRRAAIDCLSCTTPPSQNCFCRVENIELLSRYGSDQANVDSIGSAAPAGRLGKPG